MSLGQFCCGVCSGDMHGHVASSLAMKFNIVLQCLVLCGVVKFTMPVSYVVLASAMKREVGCKTWSSLMKSQTVCFM